MRRFEYPKGTQYIDAYKKIFDSGINEIQKSWDAIRNSHYGELAEFPSDVSVILVADYCHLVEWYIQFSHLDSSTRDTINSELNGVFDYDKWSTSIAEYFIEPSNGFNISSCNYCDMTYINVYEVDPHADGIYFLNTASDDELNKITKSTDRKLAIIKSRPYNSKSDFDRIATRYGWKDGKWDRTFPPENIFKYHFDLDHVLPKSKFRIGALSLFNIVPSCPICNQRLKKKKVIGVCGSPCELLSPTSPSFDFDTNVRFVVISKPNVDASIIRLTRSPQNYELHLVTESPYYENFIKLFQLEKRYHQHTKKALTWLDLKVNYSDANIQLMANALDHPSFSFKRIKSDIFHQDLYESGDMCFSKLRKDMIK